MGDVVSVVLYIVGLVVTGFAGVKVVVSKVVKAVDEVADVPQKGAEILKEAVDVLESFGSAFEENADGTVSVTAEEKDVFLVELAELKEKIAEMPKEFDEAVAAVKSIFKKAPDA